MVRSNNSPDPYLGLNNPDPYLAINEEPAPPPKPRQKGPILAEDADAKPKKPKEKEAIPSSDSVMMRSIVAAINKLTKKIEDTSEAKANPPQITVEAPEVNVAAPKVDVRTDTPRKWRIKVTERDNDDRIKTLTIEASD